MRLILRSRDFRVREEGTRHEGFVVRDGVQAIEC